MISKGIIRGNSHYLRCDDSYFSHEDDDYAILAVFDGCSSSKYASVASQLMSEIMEHIVNYHNWKNIERVLRSLYMQMDDFLHTCCASSCKPEDYRSTLIVAVINKKEKTVQTINIGDGLIFIDGKCELNSDTSETNYMIDANIVYNINHCNLQEFKFEKSVTISTDGLNSFVGNDSVSKDYIYDLFAVSNKFYNKDNFVKRTCNIIKNKNHLINDDDLAIVRYKSDN